MILKGTTIPTITPTFDDDEATAVGCSVVWAVAEPERIEYPLIEGFLLIAVFKALAIEFAFYEVEAPATASTTEEPYLSVLIKAKYCSVMSSEPRAFPSLMLVTNQLIKSSMNSMKLLTLAWITNWRMTLLKEIHFEPSNVNPVAQDVQVVEVPEQVWQVESQTEHIPVTIWLDFNLQTLFKL